MKRIDPGIMIVGEELVLAKYDTDKDGKLSDEEIAVLQADVKKAQEAKKAAILKKFDKDGDGKLSKEERKAMQEEWLKDHPEAAKRMEEMKARQEARKAEILKKYDKDGDGKLSDEEKKAMREIAKSSGSRQAHGGNEGPPGSPRSNMIKKFDNSDGKLSRRIAGYPPHHGQPGPSCRARRSQGPLQDGWPAPSGTPELKAPALPEDRKAAEAVKDAVKTVTGAPTATALTVPVPSLTPTAPRSWLPDGS
ncbi:MAG: EF-hand domain-containing protein [Akkermansia sp.]